MESKLVKHPRLQLSVLSACLDTPGYLTQVRQVCPPWTKVIVLRKHPQASGVSVNSALKGEDHGKITEPARSVG